jgi:hypothetical protein
MVVDDRVGCAKRHMKEMQEMCPAYSKEMRMDQDKEKKNICIRGRTISCISDAASSLTPASLPRTALTSPPVQDYWPV